MLFRKGPHILICNCHITWSVFITTTKGGRTYVDKGPDGCSPLPVDAIFSVYGDNYNTPDGTAIRDYTHVWDLALAHVRSVEYLSNGGKTTILNLGAGQGQSVKDILNATETVVGKLPIVEYVGARPGDPTKVIADISKANKVLEWVPKHSDLNTIIKSAWTWYNSDRYRGLSNAR